MLTLVTPIGESIGGAEPVKLIEDVLDAGGVAGWGGVALDEVVVGVGGGRVCAVAAVEFGAGDHRTGNLGGARAGFELAIGVSSTGEGFNFVAIGIERVEINSRFVTGGDIVGVSQWGDEGQKGESFEVEHFAGDSFNEELQGRRESLEERWTSRKMPHLYRRCGSKTLLLSQSEHVACYSLIFRPYDIFDQG